MGKNCVYLSLSKIRCVRGGVSLATGCSLSTIGEKASVVTKFGEKVQTANSTAFCIGRRCVASH